MALSFAVNVEEYQTTGKLPRVNVYAAANVPLYQGGFYCRNASGAIIVPDGLTPGMGFCYQNVAAKATPNVHPILNFNMGVGIVVASATDNNIGDLVYATSDNVFTLTPNKSIVGYIVDVLDAASNKMLVFVSCPEDYVLNS